MRSSCDAVWVLDSMPAEKKERYGVSKAQKNSIAFWHSKLSPGFLHANCSLLQLDMELIFWASEMPWMKHDGCQSFLFLSNGLKEKFSYGEAFI